MARLLIEEVQYEDPLSVFARFAGLPGAIFLDSALPGGDGEPVLSLDGQA